MNVYLIGFQRTGKSLYGAQLARRLKTAFIDGDQLIIEHEFEKSHKLEKIYEIHQRLGEEAFRALESQLILKLDQTQSVVALGGGAILNSRAMEHCTRNGLVIYLSLSEEKVYEHLTTGRLPTYLSSKNSKSSFEKMYSKRLPLYQKYAHESLNIMDLDSEQILNQLEELSQKAMKIT